MEEIKGKRMVEVDVTSYKFEASSGDYHVDLIIRDGEIQETGCWDSRNGGGCVKGEYGFVESCYSTIRFIVSHRPEELKKIYEHLADGAMKDFCRNLKQEMLAKFDF